MKKLIQSSRFTGKIVVVVAAVIGGASIVSSSAFASLSAVATAETTVNSGTLKLQHATPASFGAGFTTAVGALDLSSHGGLASGDTVNRFIDLSSTGSLSESSGHHVPGFYPARTLQVLRLHEPCSLPA